MIRESRVHVISIRLGVDHSILYRIGCVYIDNACLQIELALGHRICSEGALREVLNLFAVHGQGRHAVEQLIGLARDVCLSILVRYRVVCLGILREFSGIRDVVPCALVSHMLRADDMVIA